MLSSFGAKKVDVEAPKPATAAQMPPMAPPVPTAAPTPGLTASRAAPAARAIERNAPSIIGPDLLVSGNLISKGEIQIDGEIQGDIHATHVVVGDRARITGGIVAEEVVVRGHVMGSIRGRRVMLQASSHVEGDIHHQAIAIEQGAFFEGKSRRTDDPMSGVARIDQAPVNGATSADVPPHAG